jgi:hypothetical protein
MNILCLVFAFLEVDQQTYAIAATITMAIAIHVIGKGSDGWGSDC